MEAGDKRSSNALPMFPAEALAGYANSRAKKRRLILAAKAAAKGAPPPGCPYFSLIATHRLIAAAKEPLVGANKDSSPTAHKPSNGDTSRVNPPPLPKATLDEVRLAVRDLYREREKDAPIAGIPAYAFLFALWL